MKQDKNEEEMIEATMEVFESFPEDLQESLLNLARQTDSPEEFIRVLSVGDCQVCGSNKTRDCENTPLDDPCVGVCLECFSMWCLECDEIFEKGQTACEHWVVCEDCSFSTDDEGCGTPEFECSIIQDWKKNKNKDT